MSTAAGLLIDNSRAAGSGDLLDIVDPSTGELLLQFAAASGEDVESAVTSSAAAAESWAATPPAERGRVLLRCAQHILERVDALIELDVHDAGLPRSLAKRDVETAARYFEYYAGFADKFHGETIPLGVDFLDYTVHEPWGVCGIILPFNFPLQVAARDIAPALAMGNTVVAKPAEQAPLAVLAVVETCWEAGLPKGALNCIVGDGAAGEALVRHPSVDHITFTGSQRAGRRVMSVCAELVKPSTIELGGKSPHLLFEDGSVEAAVASMISTSFRSAGQACSAGTRLIVHREVHEAAVATLVAALGELRLGLADADPDIGPLISSGQQMAVEEAIVAAVADGARVVVGGGRPAMPELHRGFFVEPTVIDGASPASACAREEIFGPVLTVFTFSDEEEAVSLANDTDYGLVAGIWTRDLGRAHRVARRIRSGQIFVNNYGVGGGVELPFGGFKRSGIGRVKGLAAAREYTQLKNVCVALT